MKFCFTFLYSGLRFDNSFKKSLSSKVHDIIATEYEGGTYTLLISTINFFSLIRQLERIYLAKHEMEYSKV